MPNGYPLWQNQVPWLNYHYSNNPINFFLLKLPQTVIQKSNQFQANRSNITWYIQFQPNLNFQVKFRRRFWVTFANRRFLRFTMKMQEKKKSIEGRLPFSSLPVRSSDLQQFIRWSLFRLNSLIQEFVSFSQVKSCKLHKKIKWKI